MKKIFLLLLLTATSVMLLANNGHNVKDEKEYVEIEKEKEGIEEGRSLSFIECYIDRGNSVIEVGYFGIGIPEVIIFDSNNVPVNYARGTFDFGTITFNLPSTVGVYQILIQSNSVTAVGSFDVF